MTKFLIAILLGLITTAAVAATCFTTCTRSGNYEYCNTSCY